MRGSLLSFPHSSDWRLRTRGKERSHDGVCKPIPVPLFPSSVFLANTVPPAGFVLPNIEPPLIHARCPGLRIDFVSMIPYKGSSPRNRRTQLHVCRHLTEIQHVPIFNDICRDRVYSRCTWGQTYVGFSDFRTTTLLNQTDSGSFGACSEDRAGILAASSNGQRSSAGEHRWWPVRCPQSLERGLL